MGAIASLGFPIASDATTATKIVLSISHGIAALVIVSALALSLPVRRAVDASPQAGTPDGERYRRAGLIRVGMSVAFRASGSSSGSSTSSCATPASPGRNAAHRGGPFGEGRISYHPATRPASVFGWAALQYGDAT
jgi:hypothetical protein